MSSPAALLDVQAKVNAAMALYNLGQFEASIGIFDEVLCVVPRVSSIHNNRGMALFELGRYPEALISYARALEINPQDEHVAWNEIWCLLCAGDFERAWPRYESDRFKRFLRHTLREEKYGQHRFLGSAQSLVGKTILVWAEQGFGDVMQFARYVLELRRYGVDVIFELPVALVRLMQHSFADTGVRVVEEGTVQISEFDVHTPLLSLPLVLGVKSMADIPCRRPYLFAQPQDVAVWQARLSEFSVQTKKIGLVWAGLSRSNEGEQVRDVYRSLHVREMLPLLALATAYPQDFQFFSLQVGEPAAQLLMYQDLPIGDFTSELHDWADTAGLIANLDVVVTCCTAVAHLAGAMGKPTWILLHSGASWRWFPKQSGSPWYPSARLFWQRERGDWPGAIEDVRQALLALQ